MLIKSHPNSEIIRVGTNSKWAEKHLNGLKSDKVILQVEHITENSSYNLLVEYVDKEDYEEDLSVEELAKAYENTIEFLELEIERLEEQIKFAKQSNLDDKIAKALRIKMFGE